MKAGVQVDLEWTGRLDAFRRRLAHRGHRLARLLSLSLLLVSGVALSGTVYHWPSGAPTTDPLPPIGESWPSTWTAVPALNDIDDGLTYTHIDFVGDALNPGFYIARSANYLFFRIRVDYSETVTTTATGGHYVPFDGDSIILTINNGQTFGMPNWGFGWDFKEDPTGHGMEMMTFSTGGSGSRWNQTKMQDVDPSPSAKAEPDFNAGGRTADAYVRTVDTIARVTGTGNTVVTGNTTFVDFAIRCGYLTYASTYTVLTDRKISIACGESWNLQLASISNANDHAFLAYDIAGGQTPTSTISTDSFAGPVATYALVENVSAAVEDGQVVVSWDTLVELGTLGFELARRDGAGDFAPLHADLIPSQGNAGEGGTYRFFDPTALPGFTYSYRLTEVEADGTRRVIGDYEVTLHERTGRAAQARASADARRSGFAGDMQFTPRRPSAAETARLNARRDERAQARAPGSAKSAAAEVDRATASALSSAEAPQTPARAAIGVRAAGLHRVEGPALAAALGWPEGKLNGLIQASQVRITHQDKDIAWLADGRDLLFYAEAPTGIYDPETVYVVEQGPGLPMAGSRVGAAGPDGPASFPTRITFEENRFAGTVLAKSTDEDFWHWTMFNSTRNCTAIDQSCRTHELTLDVPAVAPAGAATLTLHLRGASALPAAPDHRVAVSLNGTPIGEGTWDGLKDTALSLPFNQGMLASGANRVRIDALNGSGVAYNYFYLDRLELIYQRRYQAEQDVLHVTADPDAEQAGGSGGGLVVAGGFSSPDIRVLDLTDPTRPRALTGAEVQSAADGYQVSFVRAHAATAYLLATGSAVRAPTAVRAMRTTGLAGRQVDAEYLLIAPEAFAGPALRLVEHRAAQGLTARFVPLEAVYDEFGAGRKTPHAIRDFLAAARAWQRPPAYVLLGGKGTLDPKDVLGYGTDRVPVLLAMTDAGVIAADQRFVDQDGDGLGDLPIGRLPAATAAELSTLVDKLIAVENAAAPGGRRALLVANNPDRGGDYTADSETVADWLTQVSTAPWEIDRLYLADMSASAARAGLLAKLGSGVDLVSYFGHAGVTSLDRGLLNVPDALGLRTLERLPLVLGMTCLINRFEIPNLTALGEALLLNPAGGAVAVWSAGGYSYDLKARALSSAFLGAMLHERVPRIGDAVQQALSDSELSFGATAAPGVYNLLGDPAMPSRLD